MQKNAKVIKYILIYIAVALLVTALFLPINFFSASELSLTIIAKDKTYHYSGVEIGAYKGKLYLKNASDIVDGIYLDTVIRSKDASVLFDTSNNAPFTISNEKIGLEIDKVKLLSEIDTALNSGKKTVTAKLNKVYPNITKEELESKTIYRAGFTTSYFNSTAERKHNIKLATKKINGVVLENGEEFSFNKTVGARTEENGFMSAKIIFNGDFIDGVGGGVCQVSTTLYNACLLSGLRVTEQHPHSLSVSYIEPSFDAMVNSITSDLKFINTTGDKIYIVAKASDSKITVSFYGLKQRESFKRVSVTTSVTKFDEYIYEEDDTLEDGSQIVVRSPKGAIKSEGYLIKYIDGKRVSNVKIRKDSYGSVKGIIKKPKTAVINTA